MQNDEEQIKTDQYKQSLLAKGEVLGFVVFFITLFIYPLWTVEWQIQKLKIQNPSRIQRQGYFSVTSGISDSVPPIYSSAWLAIFLYHAHSLAFHSISDLFLLSCYSVTTMQLFKSLLVFLPGKLIILKIFFLLTWRGFCCWGLRRSFLFLQWEFCPRFCNAKCACTAAVDTQLGPDWSRGRSLCKEQRVELAGFISHISWNTLDIQPDVLP